jgi:hypothetical protein
MPWSSMVQRAVTASNQVIGALLRTPAKSRLLLASVFSNWTVEDPSGVGHVPRVLWALDQLRCSLLLGIGSCPDVRATTSSPTLDADSMRGVPSGSNVQNSMQCKHLESSSSPPEIHRNLSHDRASLSSLMQHPEPRHHVADHVRVQG